MQLGGRAIDFCSCFLPPSSFLTETAPLSLWINGSMSAAHSSDSGIYPKTQGFTEPLSAADIYLPQQPAFPEEPSAASKTPLS